MNEIYLKKLVLKNVQKHENLEVDFVSGVNVIFGKTDSGKSCIRRALSSIYFNTPKSNAIRKIGTKKTSIKITLSNGVQVEKILSASINAYIIYINGEERRFDAIGKDIPEEVLKVLEMVPIVIDKEKLNLNIANQISLPFLLDKSATFKAKLFNSLTGADIVDKSLQSLNKDILKISREDKIEKENLEEKRIKLENISKEKGEIEKLYNKVSGIFKVIKEKQEKYDKLRKYLELLNEIKQEEKQINEDLKKIRTIDNEVLAGLNNKIDKLNKLVDIFGNLEKNKSEKENIGKEIGQLKIPKIDIKDLKEKVDKLYKLKEINAKIRGIYKSRENIMVSIDKAEAMIKNGQGEYRGVLKKYGKCPTCKSEITTNILRNITI